MRNVLNGKITRIEQLLKEMDLKIGVFHNSAGQFVRSLTSKLPMDWLSEFLTDYATIFDFLVEDEEVQLESGR
jgi:hypothetical protein